jgi:hypothetical protein
VEQLLLERVNDARADPASVGVNAAPVQPLAFDDRVKALTPLITPARIEHMGEATVNALKARLRAGGPRFLEPHSITIEAGGGYPGLPVLCLPNECFFPAPTEKVDLLVSSLFKLEGGDIPLLSVYARGRGRLRDHRVIGLSLNGDTGAFSFLTLAPADPSPILTGSVFRDANGNGKYDAGEGLAGVTITVNGQQSVLDSTFQTAVTHVLSFAPSSLAAGDFAGSGHLSIAVGTRGGVMVLLGNGDGTFQAPVFYAADPNSFGLGVRAGRDRLCVDPRPRGRRRRRRPAAGPGRLPRRGRPAVPGVPGRLGPAGCRTAGPPTSRSCRLLGFGGADDARGRACLPPQGRSRARRRRPEGPPAGKAGGGLLGHGRCLAGAFGG